MTSRPLGQGGGKRRRRKGRGGGPITSVIGKILPFADMFGFGNGGFLAPAGMRGRGGRGGSMIPERMP